MAYELRGREDIQAYLRRVYGEGFEHHVRQLRAQFADLMFGVLMHADAIWVHEGKTPRRGNVGWFYVEDRKFYVTRSRDKWNLEIKHENCLGRVLAVITPQSGHEEIMAVLDRLCVRRTPLRAA